MIDWTKIKHFKRKDFACKCGCGLNEINDQLVKMIDMVREEYGQPIYITSACRCPEHNKNEGGSETSSHLSFLALDIQCKSSYERYMLLPILMKYFTRIGVGSNFFHVDIDYNKPTKRLWTY